MADDVRLLLSRPVRHGVTTLGPGRRSVIWVQGCTLGCAGCVSRDTWDPNTGSAASPEEVARELVADEPEGITISGGEPFEQASALVDLLVSVRTLVGDDVDVLCYSGHRIEHLRAHHGEVLALVDAVIDGRYRADQPTLLPWRGSANQRLHRLTPLARTRFSRGDEPGPRPPLQVTAVGPDGLELAGIPSEGELDRIMAAATTAGVGLGGTSWL